jgi:hypothetical protein
MLPAAALAGPVPTVRYLDPQGAFRLQVPQGWQQVNLLPGTGKWGSRSLVDGLCQQKGPIPTP